MTRLATWAWCGLMVAAAACGGGDSGDPPDDGDGEASWTVLVYGHADHNLSPALETDLLEMAKARLGSDIAVLVFADWDASAGYPAGSHWYTIAGGEVREIQADVEADFDDPATLAFAVREAFAAAPADRRALILWNHGGAWRGGFGGDTNDGTRMPSAMPIPRVAEAVRQGLAAANIDEPLDLFAFDTCLLGSAEAAAELAGLATLFIANGEIDYGPGWDYERAFTYLSDNPAAALQAIATDESAGYDAHHRGTVVDSLLRAHVALDLTKMPALTSAAAGLVDAINTQPRALVVGRAVFGASPGYFNDAFSPEGALMPGLHDLSQVANILAASGDPTVGAAARQVTDALDELVIARSLGGLRSANQGGMHVELTPAAAVTDQHLQAYATLAPKWDDATGWSSLIATVASFADAAPPVVVAQGVSGTRPGVAFRVDDIDVADGRIELGLAGDGGTYTFGLLGAGAIEVGADLSFDWNGSVFAMQTSAGLETICTLPWNVAYDPDGAARVPVLFTPGIVSGGGNEALVMLVFDPSTGAAPLVLVPEVQSDTWATYFVDELQGASFQPLVPWFGAGDQVEVMRLGSIPIGTRGLAVTTATLPAGTYQLALGVRDVWGNEALVPFDVRFDRGVRSRLTARPAAAPTAARLAPRQQAIAERLFGRGKSPQAAAIAGLRRARPAVSSAPRAMELLSGAAWPGLAVLRPTRERK